MAILQIPDKAEPAQPTHFPQQESPDCATSWSLDASNRHESKENLSFPVQGLLTFTLEHLSFSLGGKTHLHLDLVDAIPGIVDTFQASDNLALTPLCEIPVVQTSLSGVRYGEKTGTHLRVAPVL